MEFKAKCMECNHEWITGKVPGDTCPECEHKEKWLTAPCAVQVLFIPPQLYERLKKMNGDCNG